MKEFLCTGNEALAIGALLGGLEVTPETSPRTRPYLFSAGYPITPVNEFTAFGMQYYDLLGATFVQAESELAASCMVLGAAAAGRPAFTATSSPGFSLMQETLSYAAGMQVGGMVIADVCRGGPGLGNIQGAQSDFNQAVRGGGHGDYELLVFAPSSVSETFSLTREAFRQSVRHRFPALILTDGYLGQMTETFSLPKNLRRDILLTPPQGVISSYYPEDGDLYKKNNEIFHAFEQLKNDPELMDQAVHIYPAEAAGKADLYLVGYGFYARCCRSIVDQARAAGMNIALLTLRLLNPFPTEKILHCVPGNCRFLVVEGSRAQLRDRMVEQIAGNFSLHSAAYPAGRIPEKEDILNFIRKCLSQDIPHKREHPSNHIQNNFAISVSNSSLTTSEEIEAGFCPGCSDRTVVDATLETLNDLAERGLRPILYAPVGCAIALARMIDPEKIDCIQAPHGRGPAAGAGSKRSHPNQPVLIVQGDGDALTIGGNELLHAIERGDPVTILLLNNGLFGMTGGQLSSSTPHGAYSSTTPFGRDPARHGYALDLAQLVKHPGVAYYRRMIVQTPKEAVQFQNELLQCLAYQMQDSGLSIIEILCICPTRQKNLEQQKHQPGSAAKEATLYVRQSMAECFPGGEDIGEPLENPMDVLLHSIHKNYEPDSIDSRVIQERIEAVLSPHYDKTGAPPAPLFPAAEENKEIKIGLFGEGGQGAQLAAKVLLEACRSEFPGSLLIPHYTPDVRRGATAALLTLRKTHPAGPYLAGDQFDLFIDLAPRRKKPSFMEPIEAGLLIRNEPGHIQASSNGILLIDGRKLSREKFSNPRFTNMILLGVALHQFGALSYESAEKAIEKCCPDPGKNKEALHFGASLSFD